MALRTKCTIIRSAFPALSLSLSLPISLMTLIEGTQLLCLSAQVPHLIAVYYAINACKCPLSSVAQDRLLICMCVCLWELAASASCKLQLPDCCRCCLSAQVALSRQTFSETSSHPHHYHHHGHPPASKQPQHLHLHRCQAYCWRANAHRCYYNSFLCWCYLSTHNYFTLHNEPRIQAECAINLCPVDSFISFTLGSLNSYKEHILHYFASWNAICMNIACCYLVNKSNDKHRPRSITSFLPFFAAIYSVSLSDCLPFTGYN